ncbi:multidrug ABC transporter ATP-binding protein [Arthrobacter sp. MYb227]|uniref:ABC transporter ATP-binding protein n=1 Tax=Arthrobacter sp. MYb227 TaxID=1848601 RepID=UPI000CFDA4C3|nr:ABC transporter ATP-binding protein [Arthrobacter sp. MYb227]PQZ89564.1 multidrug ABC transporter ATP-binding protein [Arthrobacter sp. MYb227]
MESTVSSPGSTTVAQTAQNTGISANSLARSFGHVVAVENIDFRAEPGKVTALIGPNGSGKTTLLLMLASLLKPNHGTISVQGIDPVSNPRAARAVLGWMPDTLGMWESLTGREILTTVAALYGIAKSDAATRAQELLELVSLEELADTPARVFSRGQAQRLSLARALVNNPAILLLDEPASGLDPGARVQLRVLVRQLADSGKTVVISSHVLAELDEMADAAVFISKGKTVRSQTLAEAGTQIRGYTISVLDVTRLREFLEAKNIAATYAQDFDSPRGSAKVKLASETEAAALLKELVLGNIAVTTFAPSAGLLEETYLSLEEGTP